MSRAFLFVLLLSSVVAAEDQKSDDLKQLSKIQLQQRMSAVHFDPRSPAMQEFFRRGEEDNKAMIERQAKERAAWLVHRAHVDEINRLEYNRQVERENRIAEAYNVAQAQAWARVEPAWELQRRAMDYDVILNYSYGPYYLPPSLYGRRHSAP